jgi:superfamily II DNA or RNA helicase
MTVHFKLRDYQLRIIDSIRESFKKNNKRVILCAATGAGKTAIFSFMVSEHFKRGGRILIFTHRKELLSQAGGSFEKFNLNPEYIKAGEYPKLTDNLHVAMVETFNRRIDDYLLFLQSRTMIIIDEAHLEVFTKLMPYISKDTYVIGATATPHRKGKQNCLSDFYTDLVQEVTTQELIDKGFLAIPKSYGIDIDLKGLKKKGEDYDMEDFYEKNKTYKGVVENYKKIAEHKKTIVFSSNIKSSRQVCAEFIINGYDAEHIDGSTPDNERSEILKWFNDTPNAILCNCGILTAGFDQPDIETVIIYRATTSLPLFLQMCGRGSRTTSTKTHFNILDFGKNIHRLGFWEDDRVWELKKKVYKEKVAPVKNCPCCTAILAVSVKKCNYCDYLFKQKQDEENEFVHLNLLNKKQILKEASEMDLYKKAKLAKQKIISPFWVLHQLTDINEARHFIKLMGYKKGFEYVNKNKFKVFQNV